MKRNLMILSAAAGIGMAAPSAHAHHSHPYFYDQCTSVTVEGRVESVQWKDPHTIVVLRLDDGTAYTIDWNGLSSLTTQRVVTAAESALVPGARVAVTGSPIRSATQIREHFPDHTHEVNPRTIDPKLIRRVGDSWSWGARSAQKPPECAGR